MRKIITIAAMLASIVPVGLAIPAASAQPAERIVPGPAIPKGAIVVRCCRCLDGSGQEQRVDTGKAVWQVDLPGGGLSFQPVTPLVKHVAWATLPPATWVGPAGGSTGGAVGDYTYELKIYIPRCIIPSKVQITGRFAADNSAKVFADQTTVGSFTQVGGYTGPANLNFQQANVTGFTASFSTPGVHTLRFVVNNIGGPTGLLVNGIMTSRCPDRLEYPGRADPVDASALQVEEQ